MLKKVTITPKFNTREIIDETIKKDWFEFQLQAFALGKKMTLYMQHYINNNRKRAGGTGNLAKTITFEGQTGAGVISWGIGNISVLNNRAPYWYVLNYGKKTTGAEFIPGGGKFVPGYFGDGNRANPNLKGRGTEKFTHSRGSGKGMYPGRIRPINYIESTSFKLDREITLLLAKLRTT